MLEPRKNDGKDVILLTRPSLSKQESTVFKQFKMKRMMKLEEDL